ncbi:MAG TPA: aminotransferase class V-fold PLP-dependent enzyme [Candidatus Acidoferrales bacterium]|nr:aminotransferase class V-fold PLP-dependent enzyme [Candidatus Acidoferrales bacterium]
MERVYLDNAATTATRPEVLAAMLPYFGEEFANPSSPHHRGQRVRRALAQARRKIAESLHAEPDEIVFTSGGSESDNLAIFGSLTGSFARAHFVTTSIEHHAVLHAADALRARGHRVTILAVDREGVVDPNELRAALDGTPAVVSVMHGNNEVGTLQDIARLAAVAHERGAIFHTDAVQTVGHIPVDVSALAVDLLSLSAHKFEGPKGIGALVVRRGLPLAPLIFGGGQESGRRSGTENVPGAIALSIALELAVKELPDTGPRVGRLRDALIDGVLAHVQGAACNGPREARLPNNVNLRFDGIEGDTLVVGLDLAGIEVSTGSACSTGSLEPSHVQSALGLEAAKARGAIRLSLGRTTTEAQIDRVMEVLPPLVERLRALSSDLTVAGEAQPSALRKPRVHP